MFQDFVKQPDQKRTLIIASRSFLGKFLRLNLLGRGVRVLGTSRSAQPMDPDCVQVDVADSKSLGLLLRRFEPDWIVQCSGATNTHDEQEHFRTHVTGTLHLLKAVAENAPHAKVVVIGSAAEYGSVQPCQFPIKEEHVCMPNSFFGASKLAQAHLAYAAAKQWNLTIAHVRPFNICGPSSPLHYFLGSLIANAFERWNTNSLNELALRNGTATRDFVDVRDVAEALVQILTSDVLSQGTCEIINIATGIETRLAEAGEILRKISGLVIKHESDSTSRTGVQRSCGSIARLSSLTGWAPKFSFEESIQDHWNEYLKLNLKEPALAITQSNGIS